MSYKMFRLVRNRGSVFTVMFPFHSIVTYDVPTRKKTPPVNQSPVDRIKNIFIPEKNEPMSKELNSVINTVTASAIAGAVLGGIVNTHGYVQKFISENQASQYESVREARRVLQDNFTIHFVKGALKYAWRLATFTGIFGLVTVVCTAYRGQPSFLDYTCGGAVAGLLYKLSLGIRGALVGLVVGGTFGTFCGALTMLLLRLSGFTLEDLQSAQQQWVVSREENILEHVRKQIKDETTVLMKTVEEERKNLQELEARQIQKERKEKENEKT